MEQAQDGVHGPGNVACHGPHRVQPGLRPFPKVGDLCREGEPLVNPHQEVLMGVGP